MICGYSNKLFQLRFSTTFYFFFATFYLIVTEVNETATSKKTANHTSGDLIVLKSAQIYDKYRETDKKKMKTDLSFWRFYLYISSRCIYRVKICTRAVNSPFF